MTDGSGAEDATVVVSEEYDPGDDEPLSVRVVRVVSIASDREATDLEPLAGAIDVDSLDAIFFPAALDDRAVSGSVSFRYEGDRVEIAADGSISLVVAAE